MIPPLYAVHRMIVCTEALTHDLLQCLLGLCSPLTLAYEVLLSVRAEGGDRWRNSAESVQLNTVLGTRFLKHCRHKRKVVHNAPLMTCVLGHRVAANCAGTVRVAGGSISMSLRYCLY